MSMEKKPKDAEQAIASYFKDNLTINTKKIAAFAPFHKFWRWYFDTLRTVLVVATLQFLGAKTGNGWLLLLASLSRLFLTAQLLMLIEPYGIQPKQQIKSRFIHLCIVVLLNLIIYGVPAFMILLALPMFVDNLSQAYLTQPK